MFNEIKTHEITVDIVILTIKDDALQVLLVKRNNEPFKDKWAIPGGYVRMSENLDEAAMRVLKEKTNVDNIYLEQLCTVSEPDRDPRMRVISVAYMALINQRDAQPVAGDDAADAQWFEIECGEDGEVLLKNGSEVLSYHYERRLTQNGSIGMYSEFVAGEGKGLAFDHAQLIHTGLCRLRNKAEYTPILFGLMDSEFTLPELQKLYETVLGKSLYKANFRTGIKKYVEPVGRKKENSGLGRSPELYRYKGV